MLCKDTQWRQRVFWGGRVDRFGSSQGQEEEQEALLSSVTNKQTRIFLSLCYMEAEKEEGLPLPLAVFYVVKSSIGVGVLFLPACFARLGLVNSLIATTVAGLLNCLTSVWIGELASEAKTTNLVNLCDQRWLKTTVSTLGVVMSFTTLVVYTRLVVDSMSFLNLPKLLLTILASSLILPICLLRETKTISWIALLGLVGMLYVLLLVLVDLFLHLPRQLDYALQAFESRVNWSNCKHHIFP